MDTNELRAKIEALTRYGWDRDDCTPEVYGEFLSREDVLALIPTPPAPQETAVEAVVETEMEHIARDIREGRFPDRSPRQTGPSMLGVSRMFDNPQAVLLSFTTQPTDAQLRQIKDALTQPAQDRARIEALEGLVESAANIFANSEVASGVCCCGDDMNNHSDPMSCGHSPVDMGAYLADGWMKSRIALANTASDNGGQHEHE